MRSSPSRTNSDQTPAWTPMHRSSSACGHGAVRMSSTEMPGNIPFCGEGASGSMRFR
ncbi:Uncharacterised protein [Mycobacterium tuberculosis]|nr:Uncharacterised protein [Mycobacterium tuberculosis]